MAGTKTNTSTKAKAVENEVNEDLESITLDVEVRGKEFEVKIPKTFHEISFDAGEAFESGKPLTFLAAVIDPLDLVRLKRAGLSFGDADALALKVMEAWGMAGND